MATFFNRVRFRMKLPVLIACAALVGGAAVGVISDRAATSQIKSSIDGQLRNHLATRTAALDALSESVSRDLEVLKSSPALAQALNSFVAGWTDLGEAPETTLRRLYVADNPHPAHKRDHLEHADDASLYSVAHSFYHPRLRRHRDLMGYADLMLVTPEGLVIYSVAKASDFARDLAGDSFMGEPVRAAFETIRQAPERRFVFSDLAVSHRLGTREVIGAVASTFTRPDGALLGYVIVVLGDDALNTALAHGVGFGATGQNFLVGADGLLRTRLRPPSRPRILEQTVDIAAVAEARAGKTGVLQAAWQPPGAPAVRETIVAYAPVDVLGQRYALISETPAAEVFGPLNSMREAGLLTGVAVLLLLAVVSFLLARAVTEPLDRSTSALRRLMRGDLEIDTPVSGRGDEIGDLENAIAAFKNEIAHRLQAEDKLRRAKEEADAANRAKSDFLAVMSHEIRTPMHGVLGLMEIVRDEPLSAQQREALDQATRSSQTLLGVLNDILDLSKVESGQLVIHREPVALRELLATVVDAYAGVARRKGIALNCQLADDLPECVRTDPLRVRQVLWNLIGNAVKFTDRGHVTLTVTCTEAELWFAVADTGIGIDPAALDRLFEPFQQADASTTRRYGGTGLGLSIAHRMAQLLGGCISARSALGQGACFTVRLPLERCAPPAGAGGAAPVHPQARLPATTAGAATGVPVLVVEDDPTGAYVMQRFLADAGYAATVAYDGAAALRLARERVYRLVITDYHMPIMNGIELAQQLRGHPGTATLPILVLTADALASTAGACRAAGVNAFLTKPVSKQNLQEVVKGLIANTAGAPAVPAPSDGGAGVPPAVFDPEYLLAAYDSLADADCLIGEFVANMTDSIDALSAALADGDAERVTRLAHRAAGSCFFVGAHRLGEAWRDCEEMAGRGALQQAAASRPLLVEQLAAFRAAVARTLQGEPHDA